MNVAKIRKVAAGAPPDVLLEIICETYKKVPKDKKDELDTVILSLLKGSSEEGLDQLEKDFQQFADDVYHGKYCYPYLSSAEAAQSRWHAKVKSFLKVLDGIPEDTPDYRRVGALYIALYQLMGQANLDHLFPAGNPFSVLRYSQEKLLQQMVSANLSVDSSPEMLSQLIEVICKAGCHWDTCSRDLQANLLPLLRTERVKEDALAQAMRLSERYIQRQREKDLRKAAAQGASESDTYQEKRYGDNLATLVLQIAYTISPERYLSCLDFFYKRCCERDREIALYSALAILTSEINRAGEGADTSERKRTWVACYEDALQRGIRPREDLQQQYQAYKEHKG